VRNIIGPVPDDNTAYSDLLEHDLIDPADFLHYRETTYILAAMFKDRLLGPRNARWSRASTRSSWSS
jgi:hypothetical protein